MTNEQLAELIGQGGNDELLPLLWDKMKALYQMWAKKYYNAHKERCNLCGVTADDLSQEGYLSMLEAVKAYISRTEEHTDTAFTSYCLYPFKTHAAALIGVRTNRTRNEPLNRFRGDIDSPLDGIDGDSSETIGTTTPDPEAEQPFRNIEQADYCRAVREAVVNTLQEGTKDLEVIECRYYSGKTLASIAANMGVSQERIRQIECAALKKLRKCVELQKLAGINYYRHVNLSTVSRNGSVEEQIAEYKEQLLNSITEKHFTKR